MSCLLPVPEMTYNVFSGTLNPTHVTSPYLLQSSILFAVRMYQYLVE